MKQKRLSYWFAATVAAIVSSFNQGGVRIGASAIIAALSAICLLYLWDALDAWILKRNKQ